MQALLSGHLFRHLGALLGGGRLGLRLARALGAPDQQPGDPGREHDRADDGPHDGAHGHRRRHLDLRRNGGRRAGGGLRRHRGPRRRRRRTRRLRIVRRRPRVHLELCAHLPRRARAHLGAEAERLPPVQHAVVGELRRDVHVAVEQPSPRAARGAVGVVREPGADVQGEGVPARADVAGLQQPGVGLVHRRRVGVEGDGARRRRHGGSERLAEPARGRKGNRRAEGRQRARGHGAAVGPCGVRGVLRAGDECVGDEDAGEAELGRVDGKGDGDGTADTDGPGGGREAGGDPGDGGVERVVAHGEGADVDVEGVRGGSAAFTALGVECDAVHAGDGASSLLHSECKRAALGARLTDRDAGGVAALRRGDDGRVALQRDPRDCRGGVRKRVDIRIGIGHLVVERQRLDASRVGVGELVDEEGAAARVGADVKARRGVDGSREGDDDGAGDGLVAGGRGRGNLVGVGDCERRRKGRDAVGLGAVRPAAGRGRAPRRRHGERRGARARGASESADGRADHARGVGAVAEHQHHRTEHSRRAVPVGERLHGEDDALARGVVARVRQRGRRRRGEVGPRGDWAGDARGIGQLRGAPRHQRRRRARKEHRRAEAEHAPPPRHRDVGGGGEKASVR
ncbi:hypothetical protein DFJ74DRAFT_685449 [Hyaloraphidium curvatum]|nr:hypothetical protein DFJ74DRAFT_685449 [Hyaloraphidium curvatum]